MGKGEKCGGVEKISKMKDTTAKPLSFSVQSCSCLICYQMNPHMTRLLMFISTHCIVSLFSRFVCGWHSSYLQDRPPLFKGHPALVFLHITLLMMDSFDQVLISTFASFSIRVWRTRWLLPPTCSLLSIGETTGWGLQTTCRRSTGGFKHLNLVLGPGQRLSS